MKFNIDGKVVAKALAYLSVGFGGAALGIWATKKFMSEKIADVTEKKAKEVVESQTIKAVLEETAVEAAKKITDDDITKSVDKACKIAVDEVVPKTAKELVSNIGKETVKDAVKKAMDDYDIRKELLSAVEKAAEDYCRHKGDDIITARVSKSINEKVGAIGTFVNSVSAFKSVI